MTCRGQVGVAADQAAQLVLEFCTDARQARAKALRLMHLQRRKVLLVQLQKSPFLSLQQAQAAGGLQHLCRAHGTQCCPHAPNGMAACSRQASARAVKGTHISAKVLSASAHKPKRIDVDAQLQALTICATAQ